MKTSFTNQPYYDRDYNHTERERVKEKGVSRGQWYYPVFNFTLIDLLERLLMGLKRLFVALKYQLYKKSNASVGGSRTQAPIAGKWKIPWFRIGIIGLIVFMFTQKDFQFSINMRAPQGVRGEESTAQGKEDNAHQEMNIVQAISYQDRNTKNRKNKPELLVSLNEMAAEAYIGRFRKVAVMEMKKFGIPASVKMAWGILESGAGQKVEASVNNNHFGRLMEGQPFTTAWENWRAHSLLLQSEYSGLFHNGSSYKDWIKALDKARVSTDRDFDKKLLNIIERFQLQQLDQEPMQ